MRFKFVQRLVRLGRLARCWRTFSAFLWRLWRRREQIQFFEWWVSDRPYSSLFHKARLCVESGLLRGDTYSDVARLAAKNGRSVLICLFILVWCMSSRWFWPDLGCLNAANGATKEWDECIFWQIFPSASLGFISIEMGLSRVLLIKCLGSISSGTRSTLL